jgi:hypothetical protein
MHRFRKLKGARAIGPGLSPRSDHLLVGVRAGVIVSSLGQKLRLECGISGSSLGTKERSANKFQQTYLSLVKASCILHCVVDICRHVTQRRARSGCLRGARELRAYFVDTHE